MERRKAIKNTALFIGATLSSSALSSLMQSCKQQDRLSWTPVFFSEDQALVVSELAETILPKTETPGAKDLNVDIFVDLMCKKYLGPDDQEHVMKGYDHFTGVCDTLHGKSFVDMDSSGRAKVIERMEQDSNRFNPSIWGSPLGKQEPLDFYRRIKQFTLMGYYTSEEIGKNVLKFDPIPGAFQACIPYTGDNAWTI